MNFQFDLPCLLKSWDYINAARFVNFNSNLCTTIVLCHYEARYCSTSNARQNQTTTSHGSINNAHMTTQYKHLATIDYDSTPHKKDSGALYTTATFNVLDPKYYSLLAVVAGNRVQITHYNMI